MVDKLDLAELGLVLNETSIIFIHMFIIIKVLDQLQEFNGRNMTVRCTSHTTKKKKLGKFVILLPGLFWLAPPVELTLQ